MAQPAEQHSSFPHWVTWLSLAAAVLLYFGNTVPALEERRELRATEQQLAELRLRYDAAMLQAKLSTPGADGHGEDLQGLLVAIDRLGWTPAELLRSYPERPDQGNAPDSVDEAARADAHR